MTELGAIVEKIIVIVERDEGFKYLEDISVPKIAMYQDKEIQRQLGKING